MLDFFAILEQLESKKLELTEELFQDLQKEAKTRITSSNQLTEQAQIEAKNADLDNTAYKSFLRVLLNKNNEENFKQHFDSAKKIYNNGLISIEELIASKKVNLLASKYNKYKSTIDHTQLLHLNPGEESEEQSLTFRHSTTFVHALFQANALPEDIIFYFQRINQALSTNPELANNYLELADQDGASIKDILGSKGLSQRYKGIDREIINMCPKLFSNKSTQKADPAVDTHTASIHNSIDQSLLRLAQLYDRSLSISPNQNAINILRSSEVNIRINKDFNTLKDLLTKVVSDDPKHLNNLINPTFTVKDTEEEKSEAKAKLLFQCQTALRMIKGLEQGSYGNEYPIRSNERTNSGLTIKEIVAIGFASLNDSTQWNNPEQISQHTISFFENLYKSHRGYNIDSYGDSEWKTQSDEIDRNKCSTGIVNQVLAGLSDHKLVKIEVIDSITMSGPIKVHLPKVLKELANDKQMKLDITQWLDSSPLQTRLLEAIINKITQSSEFSNQFSQDQIKQFAPSAIRTLNVQDLGNELLTKYPETFFSLSSIDNEQSISTFKFDKENGYISYLESLYKQDPKAAKMLITEKVKLISSAETTSLINFIGSSPNSDFTTEVQNIVLANLKSYDQLTRNQLFLASAKDSHLFLLQTFLKANVDININTNIVNDHGSTALHYAAKKRDTSILKALLAHGANVNVQDYDGHMAIHHAAHFGMQESIEVLVDGGANIETRNSIGCTALHIAAKNKNKAIVGALLAKGADIHAADALGLTAIHYAAESGTAETIETLVAGGADINTKSSYNGYTALHIAAKNKNTAIVGALLAKGADMNAVDSFGLTAIHYAVQHSDTLILKALLDNGADVDAKSYSGQTALHYAAELGNVEKIKLLLDNGANITAKSKDGKTALYYSKESKNVEATDILNSESRKISGAVKLMTTLTKTLAQEKLENVDYKTAATTLYKALNNHEPSDKDLQPYAKELKNVRGLHISQERKKGGLGYLFSKNPDIDTTTHVYNLVRSKNKESKRELK